MTDLFFNFFLKQYQDYLEKHAIRLERHFWLNKQLLARFKEMNNSCYNAMCSNERAFFRNQETVHQDLQIHLVVKQYSVY